MAPKQNQKQKLKTQMSTEIFQYKNMLDSIWSYVKELSRVLWIEWASSMFDKQKVDLGACKQFHIKKQ